MAWWLSFADDDGFRGVALVDAEDFPSAHLRASILGLNPGGEVVGFELPDDGDDVVEFRAAFGREALVTDADKLRALGHAQLKDLDDEAKAALLGEE